jgi:hypothetical protein
MIIMPNNKKKYYMIFDILERIPWEIIHCKSENGESTNFPEDIAKSIVSYKYIGPFKLSDYTCTNNKDVKHDYDLFILENIYGDRFIWQIGNLVHDIEGNIIPNTYHVRQIGMVVNYKTFIKKG